MPNFLNVPDELAGFDRAGVLILPVPWDGTASYGKGTRHGPEAISRASCYVETFDEELGEDVEGLGWHLLPAVECSGAGPEEVVERVHAAASSALERGGGRFLLTLGGEHSVSPGVVRAQAERIPGLSVLHLDAHADLRNEYEGSRHSHACACRRIRELVDVTVSVGIRSLSAPEAALVRAEGVPIWWARDVAGRTDWIGAAVDALGPDVYVTLDLDVLDPSIMPATGTPEPGGLGWREVVALLAETARRRNIVGADLVELAPISGFHAPDFLAARLAVRLAALAARGRRGEGQDVQPG